VLPYFLVISAIFCMILINYSSQVVYVPLLISLGETRRNIFLGFHYYRGLITLVTLALCALIWLLVPGQVSLLGLRSIPTLLTVLIISASVGSLLGTSFSRWRWVASICMFLVAGGAGGMGGYLMVDGIRLEQATTLKLASLLVKVPWWLVVTAAAVLALDISFHWMLLRRQEVKL